jgi:tRNA(fMet)-specific endonuclease VapC
LIILDTSALIDLFRGRDEILKVIGDDAATTVINYHEIFVGIKRHKSKAEERFFRRFFSDIKILDLDPAAAEKSSEIMARLLALGTTVNAFDVLIAGIAEANGADALITKDSDFQSIARVTDLNVRML